MRARLRGEDGSALMAAIATLAVVGILSAGVAANTVQLSDTSNHDRDAKRALGAAEAGLQTAIYRLNKITPPPPDGSCLIDVAIDPAPPVGGECPSFGQDLGNGTRYDYTVTPVLTTTDRCAGLPIQYEDQNGVLTVVQRCATSTGQANGVKRRVQVRVAAFQGKPLFSVAILGLTNVSVTNSASVNGQMGTNGLATIGNSSNVGGLELGPAAPSPTKGNSSDFGPLTNRTPAQGAWVLAPIDIGNSVTVNENARISTGLDASSGVTYVAATRTLTMGSNSSLTLGGGVTGIYNFCSLSMGNNSLITIAAGAKVRIFIDAPEADRPGSGCAAGSGTLTMGNGSHFSNPSQDPENLQIFVYGWNDGSNLVDFNNTARFYGTIYAPRSTLQFKNAATLTGAVAARSAVFKNSLDFHWDPNLANLRGGVLPVFKKTAWTECRANPTVAGDPESGC